MMPLELSWIQKTQTNITHSGPTEKWRWLYNENETRERKKRSQNDCEMGQIARDKIELLMKI